MGWSRRVGPRPAVRIDERWDRGGEVYASWWEAGGWRRRALGIRLRAAPGAPVDAAKEAEVLVLAQRMRASRSAGVSPAAALGSTVSEILKDYLASEGQGLGSRYVRDLERAAGMIMDLFGPDTPWDAMGAAAGPRVWRELAARSVDGQGRAWAERVVGVLHRASAWAEREGRVAWGSAPRPTAGWRQALARDWARLAPEAPSSVSRPRYSTEELERLWKARGALDPRLRTAVEVAGPESRLAQLAGASRSHLNLNLGVGTHGHGRLRLPARGRKSAVVIDLDAAMRSFLEAALTDGHLVRLEAAWRAGTVRDYPLVPGGRLVDGRVLLTETPLKAASEASVRRWYRAWEAAAGVTHLPDRGAHAQRRAAADRTAALAAGEADPEVLDALGHWAPGSAVRARIYRDREDERVRREAERLRKRLRDGLRGGREPAPDRTRVLPIARDRGV